MEQLSLTIENTEKAKQYLTSIGKLSEFENKRIEAAHWYAVIQFANQQIIEQNNKA